MKNLVRLFTLRFRFRMTFFAIFSTDSKSASNSGFFIFLKKVKNLWFSVILFYYVSGTVIGTGTVIYYGSGSGSGKKLRFLRFRFRNTASSQHYINIHRAILFGQQLKFNSLKLNKLDRYQLAMYICSVH